MLAQKLSGCEGSAASGPGARVRPQLLVLGVDVGLQMPGSREAFAATGPGAGVRPQLLVLGVDVINWQIGPAIVASEVSGLSIRSNYYEENGAGFHDVAGKPCLLYTSPSPRDRG